jgi:hypothetical protein
VAEDSPPFPAVYLAVSFYPAERFVAAALLRLLTAREDPPDGTQSKPSADAISPPARSGCSFAFLHRLPENWGFEQGNHAVTPTIHYLLDSICQPMDSVLIRCALAFQK